MSEKTPNQDSNLEDPVSQINEINEKVRAGQMDTDEADSMVARLEEKIHDREQVTEEVQSEQPEDSYDSLAESKKQQIEEVAKQAGLEESEIKMLETVALKLALTGRESLRSEQKLFLNLNEDAVRAVIDIEKLGEGTERTPLEKESFQAEQESVSDATEESPEAATEETEILASYLELKRDYKEKQRAYQAALESDMDNRSSFKKMFGLGRSNLSPETQALYDESLAAEKEYYQSFMETQKDKVEEWINRGKYFEDEKHSIVPALINRHIINPSKARLDIQERELPPKIQSVLNAVKANKYKLGTAAVALGYGMKAMSVVSSFGVGLAAGMASRWTFKRAKEFDERRLQKKTQQFNELFASGELDDLGDIKNEYFQDLRHIDDVYLASNLASAGIAVTAGTSFHDSGPQADISDSFGEKVSEYMDAAKEKFSSFFDHEQHRESWYQDVLNDIEAPDSAPAEATESTTSWYEDVEQSVNETAETTPAEAETSVPQPEEVTEQSGASEEEYREEVIEQKKSEIDVIHDETQASVKEAEHIAFEVMNMTPEEVGEKLEFRMEGGVITEVEGQPVPDSYFSEADKANIEAARMIREGVEGTSLDDALDDTEEVLGETIGEADTAPDAESVAEAPTPETQAETAELSPEAQEKLDNMRAVQEAQERAHEMMNADAEAGEGSFESLIQEVTESKYEVQPGDNIWDIIETKLQSTEAYSELEPAQQIHMIDELKDKVMAMSPGEMTEFGIGSGDPHLIEVGEELDFSKLFSEESLGAAVEHAEGLSEAEIASIEANNPQIVEASAAVDSPETPESEITTESTESEETVAEEAAPNAEVPDYSSTESVSGDVENGTVDGEEVATSEPESEATMEVVSNSPREVTTGEIMPEREKVEALFASPLVKDFQGTITPDWLIDRDAVAGFEPLYTNELLATETPVISASRLDQFITTEIFNAYAQGHINLPAQYVYMLDSVSGMDILEGINEASPQVQETLLSQFKADAVLDLSAEEVRELGVASGDLNDLTPGDQIQTGEIMKLILQNMAERINGTNA